jgi:CheY-like chemotaxis protein
MRAVVCEDDIVVRGLVSKLAMMAGHEVIAETDNPMDAVDLVERYGAGLVILDLALPVRSGADMLEVLRARELRPAVVVFTALAGDEAELRRAGAMAVIEKPDFGALEDVLATVRKPGEAPEQERRRSQSEREELPPPRCVSPSGIEVPASFASVLADLRVSDAVLVLAVTPPADADDDEAWVELVRDDQRLTVARVLRSTLRVQDRLSVTRDGELIAVLVNGGPEGPPAVVARVRMLLARDHLGLSFGAGSAVHATDDLGSATVARARGAAAGAGKGVLAAG